MLVFPGKNWLSRKGKSRCWILVGYPIVGPSQKTGCLSQKKRGSIKSPWSFKLLKQHSFEYSCIHWDRSPSCVLRAIRSTGCTLAFLEPPVFHHLDDLCACQSSWNTHRLILEPPIFLFDDSCEIAGTWLQRLSSNNIGDVSFQPKLLGKVPIRRTVISLDLGLSFSAKEVLPPFWGDS
jgi:hypothetical protein